MIAELEYDRAAEAIACADDPSDLATVTTAWKAAGYLLEHDEDGLAHDLFQDWVTAVQERGERP